MRRFHFIPAPPVIALILTPVLPFLNSGGLWLGLPKMFVWAGCWCAALTPALLVTERLMARGGDDQ
jgi:hypothetical protein